MGTLRPATALLLCGSWPTRAGLARELAQTPKPLSHLDFSRCAAVYGVLDIGPFLAGRLDVGFDLGFDAHLMGPAVFRD